MSTNVPIVRRSGPRDLRPQRHAGRRQARRRPPAWLRPAFVALLAFIAGSWRIQGPSYWIDEAATVSAVDRPLARLLGLVGHVDAVHALYYAALHVVRPWGTDEVTMRLPSAVAVAMAVYGTAVLGEQVIGARAGLIGGLLFAVSVPVSALAENARSGAFEVAAATWATVALWRVIRRPRARSWWLYGVLLVLLQLLTVWGAFLLPVHALVVLQARSSRDQVGQQRFDLRRLLQDGTIRWWVLVTAATEVLLLPFVALAQSQSAQVGWIPPVTWSTPGDLVVFLAGSATLGLILGVLALFGATIVPGHARVLLVAWLVLPAASLLVLSLRHPYFVNRYVLYSLPALGLLAGAAVVWIGTRLRGLAAVAIGVVLVLASVGPHLDERSETGHRTDLRGVAQFIRDHAEPGDAVLFLVSQQRLVAVAYPAEYASVADITQARPQSWTDSDSLTGVDADRLTIARRLLEHPRVWVLGQGQVKDQRAVARLAMLRSAGFRLTLTTVFAGIRLQLYVR